MGRGSVAQLPGSLLMNDLEVAGGGSGGAATSLSASPGQRVRSSCVWAMISRPSPWPVTHLSRPRPPWAWDPGETFRREVVPAASEP